MHVIEVLGPSRADCLKLEMAAAHAVKAAGIEAEVRKVTDARRIRQYGVTSTPGLVIDGVLASMGRVPSAAEITEWLRGN
jgi:small redox-active disulfide protein 2